MRYRPLILLALLLSAISFAAGCATVRVTDPPRTATEQFLMSEASLRAIEKLSVAAMRDRAVFIDPSYIARTGAQMSPDQTFAMGELRARLLLGGARIVDSRDK